jgi:thiamine kinase-like enzyme
MHSLPSYFPVSAMVMSLDRLHAQRLRELEFFPDPIALELLPGGITNYNYLVRTGPQVYVARLCVERELLGIDRRNEVVCQRAAHACGVAPAVIHHQDGVLVSEHIPARALTAAEVREPEFIPRLATLLRRLHDGWDRLTGEMLYFSAFQTVQTYARTAHALGARLPDDIDLLLDEARCLARRIAAFVPVLCHNDLLPANILADERRVWLVDWEYAGIGHPLFDLAGVSANCGFSEPLEHLLLAAYRRRRTVDPIDLAELHILKAMSLLREALWAVIQTVASEIEFDYEKYAADNFHAYRAARRNLERAGSSS